MRTHRREGDPHRPPPGHRPGRRQERAGDRLTSGATEANHLAILGAALAARPYGGHHVTTAIEHKAVLAACQRLVDHHGYTHTRVGVDGHGGVHPADIAAEGGVHRDVPARSHRPRRPRTGPAAADTPRCRRPTTAGGVHRPFPTSAGDPATGHNAPC
ncbi:aminotransferase class V-fold PLP-dependent enzyme [Streptomyces sp. LUP30]|uniref:aminotransferase class V-fold PLP-dependent enzyme n=1 Tax=Streptomyces sp. LUP30 TaxID=1890285 RepID=UPI0035212D55